MGGAGPMLWSLQLNEANQRYAELEERMGYVRSLSELVRDHFGLFNAENEALDVSVRRRRASPPPPPPPPPQLLDTPLPTTAASGRVGIIPVREEPGLRVPAQQGTCHRAQAAAADGGGAGRAGGPGREGAVRPLHGP